MYEQCHIILPFFAGQTFHPPIVCCTPRREKTMKLGFGRSLWAATLWWVATANANAASGNLERDLQVHTYDTQFCRCEAGWEHFYNRRRLGQGQVAEARDETIDIHNKERSLYYHYNYAGARVHNGYYVIEGVTVVPRSKCNTFNFFHRNLQDEVEEHSLEEHVVDAPLEEMKDHVSDVGAPTLTEKENKLRGLTYYYRSKGYYDSKGGYGKGSCALICDVGWSAF